MRAIAFDNRLCFPFRVYRPSRPHRPRSVFTVPPVHTARRRRDALGMSGTIVLYAPLILKLWPGAARPGRADHRELRSPILPAGATGVAPQVASTRVPVSLTVYYEADPFILRRAGWVPSHIESRQLTIQWRCQKNTAPQGTNVRKPGF